MIKAPVRTVGLILVLTLGGCASVTPPTQAAPKDPAGSEAKNDVGLSNDLFVGPTSGKCSDPVVAAWQRGVLEAIGRSDEYYLFEYVVARGIVYVALDYKRHGLSDEQIGAATETLHQFADTTRPIVAREGRWLIPVVANAESSEKSAFWFPN
jgi:hypothetical protein